MSLAEDKHGDILLDYVPLNNDEKFADPSPGFSVIILRHQGRPLLVHNHHKRHWEVPGGHREKDETPLECVLREIDEETGQSPENVRAEGLIKIQSRTKGKIVQGVIFSGTLGSIRQFEPNDEIEAICCWDGKTDIGYINEIDRKLIEIITF
jgi:8-oxo-dGTP diphosphatase